MSQIKHMFIYIISERSELDTANTKTKLEHKYLDSSAFAKVFLRAERACAPLKPNISFDIDL